jgi:tetratricopeptide (TPR) repeat protein
MRRSISCATIAAAALLAVAAAPLTAAADDRATCGDARNSDDAIAACSRLIARAPNEAAVYASRGDAYRAKGDNDRAIADYDQAIRLNPTVAAVYYGRGDAWRAKGDNDRAIADFDQAIRLNPKLAAAYYGRGNAWRAKGANDRAIADYNIALSLDPNHAAAYGARGQAYAGKGDHARAIADYDQALRLDPAWAEIRQRREHAQAALATAPAAKKPAAVPSQPAAPVVLADRRVALVIGNANYRSVPALRSPGRDAAAVADALRQDGFQTVMLMTDLDRDAMRDVLRAFRAAAAGADWALVYFAGHGLEIGGEDYLVPIDARLQDAGSVGSETIAYADLIAAVEGAQALRLVITDAARNDPFGAAPAARRPPAAAMPEQKAGTLLVFSTKAGGVTVDGDGAISPFAKALAAEIRTPGLEIRRMFDAVRDDVLEATNGRQQPFVYGSLPGRMDFFFVPRK